MAEINVIEAAELLEQALYRAFGPEAERMYRTIELRLAELTTSDAAQVVSALTLFGQIGKDPLLRALSLLWLARKSVRDPQIQLILESIRHSPVGQLLVLINSHMNTLTVSPIQSLATCRWQEHGQTCRWPANWTVNGQPLCAPHLFALPEEIQAQMQTLLAAESRRLQTICRACTDGYGEGICAYHHQKLRTFTRRQKLLAQAQHKARRSAR